MAKHKGNANYSEKQKYEAVSAYKITGSLTVVSGMLSIPYITLKKWHVQDWWKDYELDIIQANRAQSNNKVKRIAEKAMAIVEDRLDSGDYQFDQKSQKVVRVPLKAETANRILTDSMNREIMYEKLNTETKKALTDEKMADRLLKIQESFQNIKKGKRVTFEETDVIDVEPIVPELPSPTDGVHPSPDGQE